MSFDDLPENWSDLPLDTPGLAADVADLVVGHADREGGCLGLLLTDEHLRLTQPCVVNDVDDAADPADFAAFLEQLGHTVGAGAALVFVRGRPGSVLLTDADRRWHQVVIDAARAGGLRLLGAYLATPSTVRAFPEPFVAVGDDAPDDLAS